MPSAPRLNLSGAREPRGGGRHRDARRRGAAADLQALWMKAVRHVLANTEDVGERFAEEARRIHYGEAPHAASVARPTPQQRDALRDEGIEIFALPIPRALDGPVQ